MDYISTKEAAAKLGVTERWIQMQCKAGKIEGAIRFNDKGVWLVPKDYCESIMNSGKYNNEKLQKSRN